MPVSVAPTINIGDRQKGRDRAASVIDVNADVEAIQSAIKSALNHHTGTIKNPYDQGATSEKILAVIRETDLASLMEKSFHDL